MAALTPTAVLPEELLTVVGRVRLLHLGDPVPGHLPLEGRGEEGGPVVPLWGGGRAEGGHLGTKSHSPRAAQRPWGAPTLSAGGGPSWGSAGTEGRPSSREARRTSLPALPKEGPGAPDRPRHRPAQTGCGRCSRPCSGAQIHASFPTDPRDGSRC